MTVILSSGFRRNHSPVYIPRPERASPEPAYMPLPPALLFAQPATCHSSGDQTPLVRPRISERTRQEAAARLIESDTYSREMRLVLAMIAHGFAVTSGREA